jgi:VCBS repeat-containing protein
MAIRTVSNATQLQAALKASSGGDTILLAGGNYGDVSISSFHASSTVTIKSVQVAHPATFQTLNINNSANLAVQNVSVKMVPNNTTNEWDPAVKIQNSTSVSFSNSTVTGGDAVNGVSQTATALDSTHNVIGLPTGWGIDIYNSTNIMATGDKITNVAEGIMMNKATSVVISSDDISGFRDSGIDGATVSNLVVTGNSISNSDPWAWNMPYGDHADFIHLWTASADQSSNSSNIVISGNNINQGTGVAILGINLEGAQSSLGFQNVTVSNNNIVDSNYQGIRFQNVFSSRISNNVLVQSGTSDQTQPSILLRGAAHNIQVVNNIAGNTSDTTGSVGTIANTLLHNLIVQNSDPGQPGYYAQSFVSGLTATTIAVATVNERQTTSGTLSLGASSTSLSSVSGVSVAGDGTTVSGSYGNLMVHSDGSYSYSATKEGLAVGSSYLDTFSVSTSAGAKESLVFTVIGSGNGDTKSNTILLTHPYETVNGGAGADTFVEQTSLGHETFAYISVLDSTPSAHDTITGFRPSDIIDLSAITGDFHIVKAFDNHANELVIHSDGGGSWDIYGYTSASGPASLQIHLDNSYATIGASNFHL